MSTRHKERGISAAIGALVTLGLIGWLYLAHALWGVPFAPLEITDLIIRLTPGAIATAGIETLGLWAQRILKGVGLLLTIAAGAGLAAWVDPKGLRRPLGSGLGSGLILAGASFLAVWLVELALGRAAALIGLRGAVLLASLLAWAWLVVWGVTSISASSLPGIAAPKQSGSTPSLRGAAAPKQSFALEEIASGQMSPLAMTTRRRSLAQFGALALALAGGGYVLGQRLRPQPQAMILPPPPTAVPAAPLSPTASPQPAAPATSTQLVATATPSATASGPGPATPVIPTPVPPPGTPLPVFTPAPGTRPNITPLADFFVIDIAASEPVVELPKWHLQVKGLVNTPLALTFDELLQAFPRVDVYGTLQCISNEVGGDLIGTTLFSGLRLRDLLARAGPQEGIEEVVFRSLDGYSESMPWDKALRDDTLLVYGMAGTTLTAEHGYPLRLFTPNHYGMKGPKWLAEIEPVAKAYVGYWERRGWDREAIVKTTAVTDAGQIAVVDGIARLGGIAFAGWRGIQEVGVSIDRGELRPAVLDRPLSPFTWVRWRYDWLNPSPGGHTIVVRAIDGDGEEQTAFPMEPHPEGASGWHQIRVVV